MLDTKEFTAAVITGGTATVTVRTRTRLQTWSLQQVSVEMPSAPIGATCEFRRNGFLVTPLIPTGDAADGDPPIPLRGSDVVTVKWTGCTVGAIGRVLVVYDDGNKQ